MTTCYQCEEEVSYLFEDSRCLLCTRLTREEIEGAILPTNTENNFSEIDQRNRTMLNIYRVTICENDSTVAWSTIVGVASSVQRASARALALENDGQDPSDDQFELRVLSVEFIAQCDFGAGQQA